MSEAKIVYGTWSYDNIYILFEMNDHQNYKFSFTSGAMLTILQIKDISSASEFIVFATLLLILLWSLLNVIASHDA